MTLNFSFSFPPSLSDKFNPTDNFIAVRYNVVVTGSGPSVTLNFTSSDPLYGFYDNATGLGSPITSRTFTTAGTFPISVRLLVPNGLSGSATVTATHDIGGIPVAVVSNPFTVIENRRYLVEDSNIAIAYVVSNADPTPNTTTNYYIGYSSTSNKEYLILPSNGNGTLRTYGSTFNAPGSTSIARGIDMRRFITTNLTNMSSIFFNSNITAGSNFGQDIGNWNTSNVTTMDNMFNGVKVGPGPGFFGSGIVSINASINKWNVSNVTNFSCTFENSVMNVSLNNWVKIGRAHV